MLKLKVVLFAALSIFLLGSCGLEDPIEELKQKKEPAGIKLETAPVDQEMLKDMHLLDSNFQYAKDAGMLFTLDTTVIELDQTREFHREIEKGLSVLLHNISFEEQAYAMMRSIESRSKYSFPCIRLVNRKYFFEQIIGKGQDVKEALITKEQGLLDLYDEVQILGPNPALSLIFERLREETNIVVEQAYGEIDELEKLLDELERLSEESSDSIPEKSWVIDDSDKYMGFKP